MQPEWIKGMVENALACWEETNVQLKRIADGLAAGAAPARRKPVRSGTKLEDDLDMALQGKCLLVYTDGSALNNGLPNQRAGAGTCLIHGHDVTFKSVHIPKGTNNQGELTAIRIGLELIKTVREKLEDHKISAFLVSDSEYAINVITGRYNPKVNKEIIFEAQALLKQLDNVEVKWVRGHIGNPANEFVDFLAGDASANRNERPEQTFSTGEQGDIEGLLQRLEDDPEVAIVKAQ